MFQIYRNPLRMQLLQHGIKKVGETVKRDEVLVEIETDKVVLEVPALSDGVVIEFFKKKVQP